MLEQKIHRLRNAVYAPCNRESEAADSGPLVRYRTEAGNPNV
jgi:hypothetical protein